MGNKNYYDSLEKKAAMCRFFYYGLQVVILLATVATSYFFGIRIGLTPFVWLIWNYLFYTIGSREQCIDEWEDGYPDDGVKKMLKSWPIFFVIAAAYLIYVLY